MPVTLSLFPKFLKQLDLPGLAATVRRCGLDTTNLVVREGYWAQPATLAEDVPRFVMTMMDQGLTVRFATTPYSVVGLAKDPSPLEVLARYGIAELRLDWFAVGKDPRSDFAAARKALEALVPVLEQHHIRAVLQVHHGKLMSSASAAWILVQGLPERWLGIELDPGNQAHEGFEGWDKSARLLGGSLVAMGIKDLAIARDPVQAATPGKGWTRRWCALDEGVTDWHAVCKALMGVQFSGTLVLMPFYHEQDAERHLETLTRDVAYLRTVMKTTGLA